MPVAVSVMQLQERHIMAEGMVSAGRRHLRWCQSLGRRKTVKPNFPQDCFKESDNSCDDSYDKSCCIRMSTQFSLLVDI